MGDRTYFSQAGQDLFVLAMLENKRGGYYCEIGGADPFESNNTFLLENSYDWMGFSVEFDHGLAKKFNAERKNYCVCEDATKFDYLNQFQSLGLPRQIDYLSVDIEPAENTYKALRKLPMDLYRFSVITYEHDRHADGVEHMLLSREYLSGRGYQLVIENVKCFGRDFEDWWVDPMVVPSATWQKFQNKNIEFSEIFTNKAP